MIWNLFLDDERAPIDVTWAPHGVGLGPKTDEVWYIAVTLPEAKALIKQFGMPQKISFDHDLGTKETGYDFAKWLVESDIMQAYEFPDNFSYFVHSKNPVGADNISKYLNRYFTYKRG